MILLHELLSDTARRMPWRIAVIAGDSTLTYKDLDRSSDQFAVALQARGVGRGDRVALFLENSAELAVALFGVLKAGAVFVALNRTMKSAKLAYVLEDCSVVALVADAAGRRVVEPALRRAPVPALFWVGATGGETPPGDPFEETLVGTRRRPRDPGLIDYDLCAIIYTSGSTGEPKGVMLTHRNVTNTTWAISRYLENTPDDVVLCALPLSFDYGLYQLLMAARIGYTLVLEKAFAYPWDVLRRIETYAVTGFPGVPTMFATLLGMAPFAGVDVSSLRYVTNTAATLPPAHILKLQEALPGVEVFSMYGLTECTRVSFLPPDQLPDKIGSVGKAMPNSEVYVVDDEGRRVGPGETGELVVRGANVMRGYWGKPEATARCLRPGGIQGELVLHTGDLFRTDEDGFLYFMGRRDDVFKCKGEKVSPREVEEVVLDLEGVREVAVLGVEDPIDGHAVKAFVAAAPGAELDEAKVRAHCRGHLESHLVPRFVEFLDALPRTDSGKVCKAALKDRAAGKPDDPNHCRPKALARGGNSVRRSR